MNDAGVSRQIQQMVRFIRQEAEEKANEISVSAEEEFNIEKLQLVEADKKKIRQEYERKERQVEIRKIEIESLVSKPYFISSCGIQLNASRIKVLQAQDDVISSIKEAASKELLNVSHHHHDHVYRNLLKDLIVQDYADKANVDPPEIVVVNRIYLPPRPSHHNYHDIYCSGGVVLASHDEKIVCDNALDARLDVVFRKKLPEILMKFLVCRCRSESSSLDKLLLEDFACIVSLPLEYLYSGAKNLPLTYSYRAILL
ncbi:unnamed protein product [Sphenostylis stenocarpa]|uniref:V-type proton ATPase subunit E n=1 Tax=Sphenostylis stenocarpa TaxID=92480 RepID=A0AA86S9F3_9FABA|nr:unnamed protein product [Sphenostylis stenocarpa]